MSVSIFPSWTVLPLLQGFTPSWLFRTFWRFDVLNTGERKVSQSATFELAQGDPIWLLVRRLNHSAISARQKFVLSVSVTVCLLNFCVSFYFLNVLRKDHFFENFRSVDELSSVHRICPNSAIFELELDGPTWFLFTRPSTPQRLQFSISFFISVRHCFLNCPDTFFSFSFTLFDCFGLSDAFMYWFLM